MELKLSIGYASQPDFSTQIRAGRENNARAESDRKSSLSGAPTQRASDVRRAVSTIFREQKLDEPMENQSLIQLDTSILINHCCCC